MVRGLREPDADRIMAARAEGPFKSVADFTRRTKLTQFAVKQLSDADAFDSLDQDRREALWQALGQEKTPLDQPLFGGLEVDDDETWALPKLTPQEHVVEDYSSVGLSLRAHPISFYRDELDASRVTCCGDLADHPNDRYVHVAGLVIMKQRPGTAKGITFVTLEDETGVANLVIKPPVWEKHYRIARQSSAWLVHGKLEIRERIVHVLVNRIEGLSEKVAEVKFRRREFH